MGSYGMGAYNTLQVWIWVGEQIHILGCHNLGVCNLGAYNLEGYNKSDVSRIFVWNTQFSLIQATNGIVTNHNL